MVAALTDPFDAIREQVVRGVRFDGPVFDPMTFTYLLTARHGEVKYSVQLDDITTMRIGDMKDEMVSRITGKIVSEIIMAQLPEGVRRCVSVEVAYDPYMMGAKARVLAQDGRYFETQLEHMPVNGISCALKLPDTFVAHLCVSI